MSSIFGGGPSGPSHEEMRAVAKANWQSLEAERGMITGKYHGLIARLAAGGGRVGGDSALADIYKQQYEKEIAELQKSQRYKDIGAYYNRMTRGMAGGFKGGKRVGVRGNGASKLGMEDWYKYQFGTEEQKAELQPQVDIYQKEIEQEAAERRKQRQTEFSSDFSNRPPSRATNPAFRS